MPQPTVAQRAGRVLREKLAPITLSVTGKEVTADGVYLEVSSDALPQGEPSVFPHGFEPCGDPMPGPRPVQVVSDRLDSEVTWDTGGPASVVTRPAAALPGKADVLLVRLAGTAPVPSALELTLRGCPHPSSGAYPVHAGYERGVTLALSDDTPVIGGIATRFLQRYSAFFLRWSEAERQSHFGSFAAGRLAQAAKASSAAPGRAKRAPGPRAPTWTEPYERERFGDGSGDLAQLMDFYTGSSQVLAAMAARRGLGRVDSTRPKIALSTLKGVAAPTRDYDALTKALPNPSGFALDPLAKHLPADALVVEFASLRDLVALGREIDERFGAITQALEGTPGPYWLQEHYREQLALRLDGLAERLGQLALGSVALVLSDPYLREGSDVSLVFDVRDPALLSSALEAHGREAKSAHPDLTESRLSIDGRSVLLLSTPDGSIRRYQAELPRVTVVTNSLAAMRRLLSVQTGRVEGLASSADYRYARTVKPYDRAVESAFVFLGDAFMTQLTGPRSKILEARRVRAQVELQTVDYAALLYGWMQGQPPSSLQQLLDSPWLGPADLKHFDGSPIRWTPELGASSRWGTAFHLSPIIDRQLDLVSEAERTAYEEFRRGYESGWRQGVDPTLVRLMRQSDGRALEADVTILPVNALSRSHRDYSEMVDWVGSAAVVDREMTEGAVFTLAIGPGSKLRSMAEDDLRLFGRHKDLGLSFVGDWVQVGMADRAPLWDFVLAASDGDFSLPSQDASATDSASQPSADSLIGTLPLWAAVHIRNPLTLAAMLTALRAMVSEAAPGLASWNKDAPHRGIEITRIDAKAHSMSASIHYCVVRDVLLIALGREVLERRIDSILEGKVPVASPATEGHQLLTTLKPETGGVFRRLLALLLDYEAISAHQAAARGYEILHRGLGASVVSGPARRSLALRYLGYEPVSPQGGELRWTNDGFVDHRAYGCALEPAIPDAMDPALALHQAVEAIISATGAVKIEPRAREREFDGKMSVQFAR